MNHKSSKFLAMKTLIKNILFISIALSSKGLYSNAPAEMTAYDSNAVVVDLIQIGAIHNEKDSPFYAAATASEIMRDHSINYSNDEPAIVSNVVEVNDVKKETISSTDAFAEYQMNQRRSFSIIVTCLALIFTLIFLLNSNVLKTGVKSGEELKMQFSIAKIILCLSVYSLIAAFVSISAINLRRADIQIASFTLILISGVTLIVCYLINKASRHIFKGNNKSYNKLNSAFRVSNLGVAIYAIISSVNLLIFIVASFKNLEIAEISKEMILNQAIASLILIVFNAVNNQLLPNLSLNSFFQHRESVKD